MKPKHDETCCLLASLPLSLEGACCKPPTPPAWLCLPKLSGICTPSFKDVLPLHSCVLHQVNRIKRRACLQSLAPCDPNLEVGVARSRNYGPPKGKVPWSASGHTTCSVKGAPPPGPRAGQPPGPPPDLQPASSSLQLRGRSQQRQSCLPPNCESFCRTCWGRPSTSPQ